MADEKRIDLFDVAITAILVAMIVLAPLAMGSVSPWAKNALFAASLVLAALWILQGVKRRRLVIVREPALIAAALFMLVVAVQLVPLSPASLEAISPNTAGLYAETLPGYPESGEGRTLSASPYKTEWELRRIALFVLVFVVIASTVRTRGQVVALVLAMVAVGSFEAIYGLAEHFSGGKNIFWNKKLFSLDAVSGTFVNKNHFAGLLEMVVPVALGLCMAVAPRRITGAGFRARLVDAASSAGLHRQVILGVLIVIMTVAIFFSLSRAGISCTIGAWIPFFLFIGLTAGFRRYTLALLLIVLAVLCVVLGADSGVVMERMGDAASGDSVSWAGRLDLWKSGAAMVKDHPAIGTGLGTFRDTFERYQSPRFGDKYADYLHNDWGQVFCETGLAGGIVAVAGILLLVFTLARKTLARRDAFSRWTATGALAGCGAMLLHSFFDFNLYKITSNGVIFAAILGIWYVAVHMPGKDRRSRSRFREIAIPLRPAPLRAGLAILAVAGAALLAFQPVRAAAADIHLNRYLATLDAPGHTFNYFFLPVERDAKQSLAAELERARALDPGNPRIAFHAGLETIRAADALARREADRAMAELLGAAGAGLEPEGRRELAESMFQVALADLKEERRPYLEEAAARMREAIDRSPATSRFHLALAKVIAELEMSAPGAGGEFPGVREARTALWLAPGKPGVLFDAGRIVLVNALNSGRPLEETGARDFVVDCFRRAIASDDAYAEKVYALVRTALGGGDALFDVTPETIGGFERLTAAFWEKNRWDDVLRSLDRTRTLCERAVPADADAGGPVDLTSLHGAADRERRREDTLISVARRRAAVLGIVGRFEERGSELSRLRKLLEKRSSDALDEAVRLRDRLRHADALARVREVLRTDWANPRALLLAADLALIPDARASDLSGDGCLDYLLRLVLQSERLDPGQCAEVLRILDSRGAPRGEEERFLSSLIRGGALVLADRPREGADVLEALAKDTEASAPPWERRHLVFYFLGQGLEGYGAIDEARLAYARTLQDAPAHRGAAERLRELDPEAVPAPPEPELKTDVAFGGKIVLRGLTLDRRDGGGGDATCRATLYWEMIDAMRDNCRAGIRILDSRMEPEREESLLILDVDARGGRAPRPGEVFAESVDLPLAESRDGYIAVRIRPRGAPLLPADNGDLDFVMKVPEL